MYLEWCREGIAGQVTTYPTLSCIYESGTFSIHPSRAYVVLVAHSSTGDVSTNGTLLLCSRAWIMMYFARHLKEQVWGLVRLCGREGISSAAAN